MAEYPVRATLAGVLLFVIGLAMAASTVISELRERERRAAWLTAVGRVVDLLPGPAGGSPRPVVSFDTPDGERIRFTPSTRGAWQTPKAGDAVAVIYPFGMPDQARLDPRGTRWTRIGIAIGAALVLMVLGGYVAWYAQRRDVERPSAVE